MITEWSRCWCRDWREPHASGVHRICGGDASFQGRATGFANRSCSARLSMRNPACWNAHAQCAFQHAGLLHRKQLYGYLYHRHNRILGLMQRKVTMYDLVFCATICVPHHERMMPCMSWGSYISDISSAVLADRAACCLSQTMPIQPSTGMQTPVWRIHAVEATTASDY